MILFVIMLFTDLFSVGMLAVVYGKKYNYTEGMVLGVRIPKSAAEHPRVREIADAYRKKNRSFYWVNGILGALIPLLAFGKYFSVFMIVWVLWFFAFIAWAEILIFRYHRKMYDLKMEKGWIVGESVGDVLIDTEVSAMAKMLPFSHWWHLPSVLLTIAAALLWQPLKDLYGPGWEQFLMPGSLLLIDLTFWGVHLWFAGSKRVVYSMDSEVNLRLNRLDKRVWSGVWIASDYMNLAAFLFLVLSMRGKNGMGTLWLFLFTILEVLIVCGILAAFWWLKKKKDEVLNGMPDLVSVDDDIYWKNGWYSNPNDKRIFVQNRMCSTNMSINMGLRSGRVITGVIFIGVLVLMVWMCVFFIRMDFVETKLLINENTVEISSGAYGVSFEREEIQELELTDQLSGENFVRTNGADTGSVLLGKFRRAKDGENCRLYISCGISPILMIKLPEYTVYINSEIDGEVESWYEELGN